MTSSIPAGFKAIGEVDFAFDEVLTRVIHRFNQVKMTVWCGGSALIVALAYIMTPIEAECAVCLFCTAMLAVTLLKRIQPGGWIRCAQAQLKFCQLKLCILIFGAFAVRIYIQNYSHSWKTGR
jgi:hypothetical protein